MRSTIILVALVLSITLAGCVGPFADDTDVSTPETEVPEENPYGTNTLVVTYNESAAENDLSFIIKEALSYWENNSERYAGYPISYEVNQSHPDPDLHIEFVDEFQVCDSSSAVPGCANGVTGDSPVPDPVLVEVQVGYTNATLKHVMKHEIGHTLNVHHDDEPQEIMEPQEEKIVQDEISVQVRVGPAYDENEVVNALEDALEAWESYFANRSHVDLNNTVTLVKEFNESADIAYLATAIDGACDGEELVCATEEHDGVDIVITTEHLPIDEHEKAMRFYYGFHQMHPYEEYPSEYQIRAESEETENSS